MLGIQTLDLDIMPDYIFFVAPCTKADGTKINPTVDNLIVYEEDGADAAEIVAADEIANSPFDPVQLPTDAGKTGLWGINIAKTNFTAGRFYLFLWEMTVDGVETHATEKFFFRTTSQVKADVSNLDAAITSRAPASEYDTEMGRIDVDLSTRAVEGNVEGHCTDALDTYDPPTRAEATADKDEVIAAYSTDQQDFNVAGD